MVKGSNSKKKIVMNSRKKIIALLFGFSMLFSLPSCIDDKFETPDLPTIPIGHPITIDGLRQLCPPGNIHKFAGDTSVFAVVSMDDKSGNLYREVYVQDHTGGIVVRLLSPGGLYQGDSIYINLNGTSLKYYRSVFQIDSVDVVNNVVKVATNRQAQPKVVTIPELSTFDYESQLIKIEGVQFISTDTSKTYADKVNLEYGERTLQDTNGNTIMVRTSGYAKFADQNIPNGLGSVVAIAGRYDNNVQLAIRRTEEVSLHGDRWDMFEGYNRITINQLKALYSGGTQLINQLSYIEATVVANDESGNYYRTIVVQDETSGIEVKIYKNNLYNLFPVGTKLKVKLNGLYLGSYGELVQLGYIFNGNFGSIEEYLIGAHFEVVPGGTPIEPTTLTINTISDQHLGKLIRLENVEFIGADIGKAWAGTSATNRTLTNCSNNTIIVRTSNYADFASQQLPYGNGELVAILSKFTTTYQLYIRSLNDVLLDGERCTHDGSLTGSGTQEDPYDVMSGVMLQNATPYEVAWVRGYIIGAAKSGTTSITSSANIDWNAPFSSNTNVLIADNPSETDYNKCIAVNLPAGTALRTQVNLLDNPGNKGKLLNVKGTLRTYFGIPGMRDGTGLVTDFELTP